MNSRRAIERWRGHTKLARSYQRLGECRDRDKFEGIALLGELEGAAPNLIDRGGYGVEIGSELLDG